MDRAVIFSPPSTLTCYVGHDKLHRFPEGILRSGFGLAIRLLGLGWHIALSTVLGTLGGSWLDEKLDTRPIFTMVGLVLGLLLAGYGAFKLIRPLLSAKDDAR